MNGSLSFKCFKSLNSPNGSFIVFFCFQNKIVEPFKDWEEEDDRINQSVNFEGVCRTALTTPGLLNMAYFEKNILLPSASQDGFTEPAV